MLVDLHQLDRKYEGLKIRSRTNEAKLLASLESDGQQTPVVVVRGTNETSPFIVIDGFKRVRAAGRLGMDQLECSVWDQSEVDALVQMHALQRPRERSALDDAYLIRALQEEHGLSLTTIGHRLGRTKSWVSRRVGLVRELPDWLQEHIRKGELQCYAVTKYLLPLARANREHAKLLARELAGMNVTTRDVADLYYAWKIGSEEERLTVLSRPDLVLAARHAQSQTDTEDQNLESVLKDLAVAESLLRRALRSAKQLPGCGLEAWSVDSLRQRKRRVWEAITLLDNRLMEVLDEGPGSGDEAFDSPVE
jgi:ParB family transcriptional regulator, chromosome partitioning protein